MPAVEIDEQFRPKSDSVRGLFEHAGGFSIPAYQRPYRWAPQDIRRLIEDLLRGIERLRSDPVAVAFIGTMITVSRDAGPPHHNAPAPIFDVIDGQQRISTILMLCIELHQKLGSLVKIAGNKPATQDQELVDWLIEQVTETRGALFKRIALKRETGDDIFLYLPKVVREQVDTWSNREATARYASPIAYLIYCYIKAHERDEEFKLEMPPTIETPEAPGSAIEDHELVHKRYREIRRYVNEVGTGNPNTLADCLDIEELLSTDSSLLEGLFADRPNELRTRLLELTSEDKLAQLFRVLTLSRFLLDHVALTQINAKDEFYAFDLFDSLNTTGEPLTAFETFRPLVVNQEGTDTYAQSPSALHLAVVSKILASSGSDIQRETAGLITSFLLADAGLKVGNKHNDQRRELSRRYQSTGSAVERRAMTGQLKDSAVTSMQVWKQQKLPPLAEAGEDVPLDRSAGFALKFAESIRHTILQAPLSRFASRYINAPSYESKVEVERVSRGMVAFSVLWRTALGGTANIDGVYRRLMESGLEGFVTPVSRTPRESHTPRDLPSADSFVGALRECLLGEGGPIRDRDAWVNEVVRSAIYAKQPEIARFLLLLGSHHRVSDGTSGLTAEGAENPLTDYLTIDSWDDPQLMSIEHVAPQNPRVEDPVTDWTEEIYTTESSVVDRIGNLTLVPIEVNSQLSNRTWLAKKALYAALSAGDTAATVAILDAARAEGIEISDQLYETVRLGRRYLPMLDTVAAFAGDWNVEFIEARGRQILELAWEILDGWLTAAP